MCIRYCYLGTSGVPGNLAGKNPPALQETLAQFLDWDNPLQEGMATYSSTLAWRIPMDQEASRGRVHGVAKSWTELSD